MINLKLEKLDTMDKYVTLMSAKLHNMDDALQRMDRRSQEMESQETKTCLSNFTKQMEEMRSRNNQLKKDNIKLHNNLVDMQARGVRENLLFCGFQEKIFRSPMMLLILL